jgi:predicted DNA binding CopG/RHH family protein
MTVQTPYTVDTLASNKKPKPGKPPRDRIDLRVKSSWYARVQRQADRLGMDVSTYIRHATTLKLEQDEASDPEMKDPE